MPAQIQARNKSENPIKNPLSLEFSNVFVGAQQAHGRWPKNASERPSTEKGAAQPEHYALHLAGEVGLGVVPVREDGTCRFAAIDVDQDTVDHARLAAEVARRRLPLSVCRSKSGGAHFYLFVAEPGLPAGRARELLMRWAGLLGFPSAEIFPKQVKTGPNNKGNWLNLPYFASERTVRYAVGADGKAQSLAEFLASVKFFNEATYHGDETIDTDVAEMPPCLQYLSASGIPEGARNQGTFNIGVFFRKSDPEHWRERTAQFNSVANRPPLSFREVTAILKSLGQTRYQFTCEQSPIREFCDRQTCLKLRFGVAHRPWEEGNGYATLQVSNLRKVLTDPPHYFLDLNGHQMSLSLEEFLDFAKLRRAAVGRFNLLFSPMKAAKWDAIISELLKHQTDIPAPPDSSVAGQVNAALDGFLEYKDKARTRQDLLCGLPFQLGDKILFRFADFQRHLQARRLDKLSSPEVFSMLLSRKIEYTRMSICGKKLHIWMIPVSEANLQTEDFSDPESNEPKLEDEI